MKAFEEYMQIHFPQNSCLYDEFYRSDMEAAFKAGMLAAAEIASEYRPLLSEENTEIYATRMAIVFHIRIAAAEES